MKPGIVYEDRAGWPWWVHVLLGAVFLASAWPMVVWVLGTLGNAGTSMPFPVAALALLLGAGIPGALYAFMGELRIRVKEDAIDLRWGILEVIGKSIPFRIIRGAEAVTYSPLGEFGGWGIRVGGGKKRAWTVRGNRALLLHLEDGTRFYLGSARPERILQWVHAGLKGREE
mgnify:CR=1 FL=1